MIFDLDKYIDEPLVYDDDRNRIDDQKVFLLGVKIRADLVEMLLNGVKAKDIVVKKILEKKELSEDFAHSGYVAYSITDISNREVESFDL